MKAAQPPDNTRIQSNADRYVLPGEICYFRRVSGCTLHGNPLSLRVFCGAVNDVWLKYFCRPLWDECRLQWPLQLRAEPKYTAVLSLILASTLGFST